MKFEIEVKQTRSIFPKELKIRVDSVYLNSSESADGCVGLRSDATPEAPAIISIYGPGNYAGRLQEVGFTIPGGGLHVSLNSYISNALIKGEIIE